MRDYANSLVHQRGSEWEREREIQRKRERKQAEERRLRPTSVDCASVKINVTSSSMSARASTSRVPSRYWKLRYPATSQAEQAPSLMDPSVYFKNFYNPPTPPTSPIFIILLCLDKSRILARKMLQRCTGNVLFTSRIMTRIRNMEKIIHTCTFRRF